MNDDVIKCKQCDHWKKQIAMHDPDGIEWRKCPVLGIMTKETFYCVEANDMDTYEEDCAKFG